MTKDNKIVINGKSHYLTKDRKNGCKECSLFDICTECFASTIFYEDESHFETKNE